MCRCVFYRFCSNDHHERLVRFMQISLVSVFPLASSAEV